MTLYYGLLYKEYTATGYFWEIIKIYEKIFIVIILNFYSQNIKEKGLLIVLVIGIYGIMSKVSKPYVDHKINKLD